MSQTISAVSGFSQAAFDNLLASRDEPGWLIDFRRRSWQTYGGLDLPSQRHEEWARTDIRLLRLNQFGIPSGECDASSAASVLGENVELCGFTKAVNGGLREAHLEPSVAARGVLFGDLSTMALEHPEMVRAHLFQRAVNPATDKFSALHAACWTSGTFLYVPRGVSLDAPLLVHTTITEGSVDLSHLLVVLDEGAEVTLLVENASPDTATNGFHCGASEVIVGPRANLRFVSLQDWGHGVWHFAHQHALLERDARLQWTTGSLGSRLSKINQQVSLLGKGAACQVNGVLFAEGKQHLSCHTKQHHVASHCQSDFLYKAALQDHARTVWRGMIKVDPNAQKTDGYQRNDNLLLSSNARADAIPGLEIEADDVRCTHGATTGRVDDELIFYAQSRGFTRREAVQIVVTGFFQQIFDRISLESVRDALGAAIAKRVRDFE
jgi:Fe-S cluster assembly protein SufD